MRAHSSLRLGTLHGTTPELLASPWYCAWGFCMGWEAGSPTRRPLLPLNAGTAEPVRVSPPEAVAYLLELFRRNRVACVGFCPWFLCLTQSLAYSSTARRLDLLGKSSSNSTK